MWHAVEEGVDEPFADVEVEDEPTVEGEGEGAGRADPLEVEDDAGVDDGVEVGRGVLDEVEVDPEGVEDAGLVLPQ